MERELLLLGLLRDDDMHGYQINEQLGELLGDSMRLKKATVYRLLAKMEENGWVSTYEEQEHNRPPRRVYAITADGETQFEEMLRRSLPNYRGLDLVGMTDELFWDALPMREAVRLLRRRRSKVDSRLLETYRQSPSRSRGRVALRHSRRLLQAELDWLDELIAEVSSGETALPVTSEASPLDASSESLPQVPPQVTADESMPTQRKRRPLRKPTWQPEID